ncbi:MAG: O-antigen ligase family protein [Acetobacteraceae bacterium]|nr:O-antigen ligase family protein [Acetobacteraceae bacterium]
MTGYLAFFQTHRGLLLRIVLGAGFAIVPNPSWAMLFYLAILPGAGLRLARGADWPDDLGARLGVALIFWFTLTTLWDSMAGAHLIWVWNGACTLGLFITALATLREDAAARDKLLMVLIIGGLVNAVLAIGMFLHAPSDRMTGWAETRHPILGASIIGGSVVLATGHMLRGQQRAVMAATIASGLLFIVLTGSRGPLIAIGGALVMLLAALRPRVLAGAALGLMGALGAVFVASPGNLQAAFARAMERGWSNRLEIWDISLGKIAQTPIFGSGPATLLDRPGENFPHNLVLSTWLYSGLIGVMLLLALLAFAARAAWSDADRIMRWTLLALLLHLALSGLTDLSQVTKGPGPMWYILWLPIVLALSAQRADSRL